jgi:hypothetical protein
MARDTHVPMGPLGEVMRAAGVGQVIESHPDFKPADLVLGVFGWNTGNSIPISAKVLRHSLEGCREIPRRRADGSRARGRMVVIGHSQGGLLARSSVRSLGIVRHVVQEDAVPRMSAQTSIVTSSLRVAPS